MRWYCFKWFLSFFFSLLLVNLNSSMVAKYEPNLCKMKLYATFIIHIFNAESVRYEHKSNTLVKTPAPDPEIPRICVDCLKFWISVRNKTRTKSVVINCELRAIHKINSYSFTFIVNQRIYFNITTIFFFCSYKIFNASFSFEEPKIIVVYF